MDMSVTGRRPSCGRPLEELLQNWTDYHTDHGVDCSTKGQRRSTAITVMLKIFLVHDVRLKSCMLTVVEKSLQRHV